MQGGWRLLDSYWVLVEGELKEAIQRGVVWKWSTSPTLWGPEWPSAAREGIALIGVLPLPTLSGGMQRWNR